MLVDLYLARTTNKKKISNKKSKKRLSLKNRRFKSWMLMTMKMLHLSKEYSETGSKLRFSTWLKRDPTSEPSLSSRGKNKQTTSCLSKSSVPSKQWLDSHNTTAFEERSAAVHSGQSSWANTRNLGRPVQLKSSVRVPSQTISSANLTNRNWQPSKKQYTRT